MYKVKFKRQNLGTQANMNGIIYFFTFYNYYLFLIFIPICLLLILFLYFFFFLNIVCYLIVYFLKNNHNKD